MNKWSINSVLYEQYIILQLSLLFGADMDHLNMGKGGVYYAA
ncbi:hypothetical protein [Raoultella sp. T31]